MDYPKMKNMKMNNITGALDENMCAYMYTFTCVHKYFRAIMKVTDTCKKNIEHTNLRIYEIAMILSVNAW